MHDLRLGVCRYCRQKKEEFDNRSLGRHTVPFDTRLVECDSRLATKPQ